MYYTYLWSLVIAKDLLSEFQRHGLLDADTARRYREAVLVPGGSRDAAQLVETFLGRPYGFAAFKAWLNRD
jgi:thimet oligopeptidase